MTETITFTALVTGLPPGVRLPEMEPGETRLQFLVRHHPEEWDNFTERIATDLGLSGPDKRRLFVQDAAVLRRPEISAHVGKWVNLRLPSHWRTVHCLADLRSSLAGAPLNMLGLRLEKILWPRERNPSGDDSAERMVAAMGAEVVSLGTGGSRELDLRLFLPLVRGRYLWLVPGGSRFMPSMTAMSLRGILSNMEATPSIAVYADGACSMIYGMASVQAVADTARETSLSHANLCRAWERMRLSCTSGGDPENPLCEIEQIFGGTYPFPKPAKERGWLARLFGG